MSLDLECVNLYFFDKRAATTVQVTKQVQIYKRKNSDKKGLCWGWREEMSQRWDYREGGGQDIGGNFFK